MAKSPPTPPRRRPHTSDATSSRKLSFADDPSLAAVVLPDARRMNVISSAVSSLANYSPGPMQFANFNKPSWNKLTSPILRPTSPTRKNTLPQEAFTNSFSSLATSSSATSDPAHSSISTSSLPPLAPSSKPQQQQFFVEKRKKKHHAYGKKVPYMLSYEPRVLDHHNLDMEWQMGSSNSVTYHLFETPPKRVLDLGCGTGAWVLAAAKEWKDAHFIGFDLVPIQVNLDFLDPDPPSYPATAKATRGRSGSVNSYRTQASTTSGRPSSLSLEALVAASANDGTTTSRPSTEKKESAEDSDTTGLGFKQRIKWVHGDFLERFPFPDEYFDYVHIRRIARGVPENMWDHILSEINRVLKPGGAIELIEVDLTLPGGDFRAAYDATAPPTPISAVDVGGSPRLDVRGRLRRRRDPTEPPRRPAVQHFPVPFTSLTEAVVSPLGVSQAPQSTAARPMSTFFGTTSGAPAAIVRTGSREMSPPPTVTTAPPLPDPRDHSLLEAIYAAAHARKFINLNPVSIIQGYLSVHFTKVRTHPPLILLIPEERAGLDGEGTREEKPLWEGDVGYTASTGLMNAVDLNQFTARALGIRSILAPAPTPVAPTVLPPPETNAPSSANLPPQSLESLVQARANAGTPPPRPYKVENYLALDRSRVTSRIKLAPIVAAGGGTVTVRTLNGLPNRTFQYDFGHANLHLSIAVADVLGCAEEMWDYVRSEDEYADRTAFEDLLDKYAIDMRSRINVGPLLESRLGWEGHSKGISPLQKEFETRLQRALEDHNHTHVTSSDGSSKKSTSSKTSLSVNTHMVATPPVPNKKPRDVMGSYCNGHMVARTLKVWCAFKEQ